MTPVVILPEGPAQAASCGEANEQMSSGCQSDQRVFCFAECHGTCGHFLYGYRMLLDIWPGSCRSLSGL